MTWTKEARKKALAARRAKAREKAKAAAVSTVPTLIAAHSAALTTAVLDAKHAINAAKAALADAEATLAGVANG